MKYKNTMELINRIKQYQIVSFDIFDTLIKRDVVDPQDVFQILEKEYKEKFNSSKKLYDDRIFSEKKAVQNRKKEEILLDEIYSYLENYTDEEKKWLIKKEQEIELSLCHRNEQFYNLYNWCRNNNKTIYIISDMYLPKKTIEIMLEQLGYTDYRKLYVSSDVGLRKSTGNLFRKFIDGENIDARKTVHIGDSWRGDYIVPLSLGIKVIHIDRKTYHLYGNKKKHFKEINKNNKDIKQKLETSILFSFINNRTDIMKDDFYRIGYEAFGPILYGYTRWLHERVNKFEIKKIFFLAREGELLEKAYDVLYPDEKYRHMLLRVSRYSVARAILGKDENAAYDEKIQTQLLMQYLSDCGFTGKVAVADIGYMGSMQHYLHIYKTNAEIKGFYIGKRKTDYTDYSEGFLFDDSVCGNIENDIFFTASFFENCFMGNTGTTWGYIKSSQGVMPKIGRSEQTDGMKKNIKSLQKGALKFLEQMKDFSYNNLVCTNPKDIERYYSGVITPTSYKLISLLKDMAVMDSERKYIISEKTLGYYLMNYSALKKDFVRSSAKLFFLKSILRIPFPYYELLSLMRKIEYKCGKTVSTQTLNELVYKTGRCKKCE